MVYPDRGGGGDRQRAARYRSQIPNGRAGGARLAEGRAASARSRGFNRQAFQQDRRQEGSRAGFVTPVPDRSAPGVHESAELARMSAGGSPPDQTSTCLGASLGGLLPLGHSSRVPASAPSHFVACRQ